MAGLAAGAVKAFGGTALGAGVFTTADLVFCAKTKPGNAIKPMSSTTKFLLIRRKTTCICRKQVVDTVNGLAK
jgi:hypothetical protein